MIHYSNINIRYRSTLLENVSMTIEPGKLTLIEAPSGSGKTALLYRLALIKKDCQSSGIQEGDVSFVMQDDILLDSFTVSQNIREYAAMSGIPLDDADIEAYMKKVQLDVPLDQESALLSMGEKQRLCIACALARDTSLIVMDEPTASLDIKNRHNILNLLREIAHEGKYVVFSSHDSDAYAYADVAYTIKEKSLVIEKNEGTINTITANIHQPRLSFPLWHALLYAKRNTILLTMATFFIAASVLLSSVIQMVMKNNAQANAATLYASSDRFIYVTTSENQGYIDKDAPISKQLEGYPVYRIMTMQGVSIVPYYDEDSLKQKTLQRLSFDEHGIYMSYDTYVAMKQSQTPITNEMDMDLFAYGKEIHIQAKVAGILQNGVVYGSLYNEEEFIMMWHEDLEELDLGFPCGYAIPCDTHTDAMALYETYKASGYVANGKNAMIDTIAKLLESESRIMAKANIVLILTGILLLGGTNLAAMRKRMMEFTILIINGIKPWRIGVITLLESVPGLMTAIIFGLLPCMAIDGFLPCFTLSLCSIAATEAILSIIDIFYLTYYNPEKILRD